MSEEMKQVSWQEAQPSPAKTLALDSLMDSLMGTPLESALDHLSNNDIDYRVLEEGVVYDDQHVDNRVNLTVSDNLVTGVALG